MRAKNVLAVTGLILLATICAAPASADPIVETYTFTGTCTDCSGTVTGTLTLDSSYVLGNPIGPDFLSFVYDGSNLIPGGFTISDLDAGVSVSGSLPSTLPGAPSSDIVIENANWEFLVNTDGSWSVVDVLSEADYGTNGSFSDPAPEPSSAILIGCGLVGLRLVRRRMRRG